MNRQAFCKAYKEYAKLYTEKEYEKCMVVFLKFDLNAHYLPYREISDYILRSACHSLSLIPNPKIEYKISVAKAFNDVLKQMATTNDYVSFFSLLNSFTKNVSLAKGLEKYVPFFTNLKSSNFDSTNWLMNVNKHLFQVLNNANIIDDTKQTKRKEIYVELTSTLLYFIHFEPQQMISMENPWQFHDCQRFLKSCTEFPLFRDGDTQYNDCFKLLSKFLKCLSIGAENGGFAESMQKFLKRFKTLVKSNKVRATLFRDVFVTIAKATKLCEQRFNELVNLLTCETFFDFIGYISNGISQTKTEKKFQCQCDATHIHLLHEITMMAVNCYVSLVDYGPDTVTAEKLGAIMRVNFDNISKLNCTKAQYVQHSATNSLRSLMKTCKTKKTGQLAVNYLKPILKRYHRFKLIKEVPYFDNYNMISYLFNAHNCAENWNEAVDFGYLLISTMSVSEQMPNFEHSAWTLAKIQKAQNNVQSPFDFCNKLDTEPLYGFTLPNDFRKVKFTLNYLKIGIKYNIMSTELSNKIVDQLLMAATKDDWSPLRFVFVVQSMNFHEIVNKRIEKLTRESNAESDSSIGLILAVIKYFKFNYDTIEFAEKHKDLHTNYALSEEQQTSETNIFKEITFDREKSQINTLRYIKQKFIEFTNHYIKHSTPDERASFEDERNFLLRELKILANQFVVRGYIDDGLDLYMLLYRLSLLQNDEFGVIDSCSFFAEHSVEFKQKFPNEKLAQTIEGCFSKVIGKLKVLKDLSTRKQNQVGFCMLNLVLYYHEDGGNHSGAIHTILKYIFTSIGGIRDKNMGDCLKASTGISVAASYKTDGPKIDSEAVRIKFYAVLFTMITKYNAPSTFSPNIFLRFIMEHIRKYLSVYHDSTVAVPILLYNMVPQMATWLHSIYEVDAYQQSILLTLLKLAIRSGYALRTASLIVTLVQTSLLTEDLKYAKTLFMALESITLSPAIKQPTLKKDAVVSVDNRGYLCEPIRKQGVLISPVKNASPSPTARGAQTQTHKIKFLQEHSNSCDCGPCFSPETKFQMFCAAVVYARFVYLNEEDFSQESVQSVFKHLHSFWEGNRKDKIQFPRTDMFYVMSARMLLYSGHYFWKFENNWETAVLQLKRGLKGLEKVKNVACLIKQDLELQIQNMEETIQEKKAPRVKKFLRSQFLDDETMSKDKQMKKPSAPTKKITKPQLSLFELINEPPTASSTVFQIHDDGIGASSVVTPNVKKLPRNRLKKIDELPIRTPSQRKKPTEIASESKKDERPIRGAFKRNLMPTMFVDLCSESEASTETKSSPEILEKRITRKGASQSNQNGKK